MRWLKIMSDLKKELLKKIDAGEKLTESELKILAQEFDIERIEGDDHRWQREIRSICKLGDRLFAVDWMSGLTEMQEDNFWEQPFEVEKVTYTKTVEVTEYKRKGDKK